MIKLSKPALLLPMKHLINSCFTNRIFPNIWRISKIIALYTCKGSREDPLNYRPIAILSPLSKVLEKEIQWQINEHMEVNNLWHKDLNAYREKYSTIHALSDVFETWIYNVNYLDQNLSTFLTCQLPLTVWSIQHF